jgi:hypothetical protein
LDFEKRNKKLEKKGRNVCSLYPWAQPISPPSSLLSGSAQVGPAQPKAARQKTQGVFFKMIVFPAHRSSSVAAARPLDTPAGHDALCRPPPASINSHRRPPQTIGPLSPFPAVSYSLETLTLTCRDGRPPLNSSPAKLLRRRRPHRLARGGLLHLHVPSARLLSLSSTAAPHHLPRPSQRLVAGKPPTTNRGRCHHQTAQRVVPCRLPPRALAIVARIVGFVRHLQAMAALTSQ